jgi:hypothetical protein
MILSLMREVRAYPATCRTAACYVCFRPVAEICCGCFAGAMSDSDVKRIGVSWPTYSAVAAVLLVGGCVVATRIDASRAAREFPYQKKALEKACATFPIVNPREAQAVRALKRSIASGETDPQRDLIFQSGRYDEGVFVPYPRHDEYSDDLQLQLIDIFKDGRRLFTVRLPTLVRPTRGFALNQPRYHTMSCTQFNVDQMFDLIRV